MTRLAALVLRAYPPSFRERYGAELAALVEDLPAGRTTTVDLIRGAMSAWLRPSFAGDDARRARLQSSAATVWVAWCAGFLIAPAVSRALLDPPTPGTTTDVRLLLTVSDVLVVVGGALALLGASPVVLRCVVPAVRARQWSVLRPLMPAMVMGLVETAGLAPLALSGSSHVSTLGGAMALCWVIGLAAFVVCAGIGPAVAVRRVRPTVATLRPTAIAGFGVAVLMAALTACSLAAVLAAGDATLVGSRVVVDLVLGIAVVAASVALVSGSRGLRAAAVSC